MKLFSVFSGATLLAALLLGGSASGRPAEPETNAVKPAPAALAPPAGNVLFSIYRAHGVQVYQCTAGAWVFVEPVATLTGIGRAGLRVAVHFRGPSWESTRDGTLVEAKVVASSPVTGTIPELLLAATRTRGEGDFGAVTYIQRLATSRGVAPAGGCADGTTTGVSYRADYRFYTAG